MKNVFVGNIPFSFTDLDLKNLFVSCGNVVAAKVIRDKFSGRSRGFGIVELRQEDEVKKAIEMNNGKIVAGQHLVVNESVVNLLLDR